MDIKVINKSNNPLPTYATANSAGMDLRANITAPVTIDPFKTVIIGTGLYIQLPEGYEAQIRPRSGLAIKHGITVVNTPGTIDADYRGEIKIGLINLSDKPFTIYSEDRIAQMIVSKYEKANLIAVNELDDTDRGDGGFGHTGVK